MPVLTSNKVNFTLRSMTPEALPDLIMSISLLKDGALNIRYTMADETKAPFEVPADIIDVNRTNLASGAISDYVKLTNSTTGLQI